MPITIRIFPLLALMALPLALPLALPFALPFALPLALALLWSPAGISAQPATFAPLVKQQRGKVVHIDTRVGESGRSAKWPFQIPDHREGLGSGFIISSQGLIVTNQHVVADAKGIEVVLASGERFKAGVVGEDASTDLALIKIDGKSLPATRFGDSDRMEVGDWVLAIGNPLGLDYSVTAGIISAKGRNIFGSQNLAYGEFIQTDAAINPGNSGGPLFNLKGEVIGVNTAISRRGHGIGFAVPSNIVVEVVRQLKRHGRVLRGWLGVVIQDISRDAARSLGLPGPGRGVLVEEILPDGPAAAAGMQEGDVLTRFGGKPLRRVPQLQKLVAFSKPGKLIAVEGLRRAKAGGTWKVVNYSVRITAPPGQTPQAGDSPLDELGFAVGAPPARVRRALGLRPGLGVMVKAVIPLGRAEKLGLRKGDIILRVDQQEVSTGEHLGNLLEQTRGRKIRLLVRRNRQVLYFVLAP